MQKAADTTLDPSFGSTQRQMKEKTIKPAQGTAGREALSSDGLQELLKNFSLSAKSHIYTLKDHTQNHAINKAKNLIYGGRLRAGSPKLPVM